MAQWIERSTSNRKAAGSSPAVDLYMVLYMGIAPILLTVLSGILILGGAGVLLKRENSYWSDGTRKVSRVEAEQNIMDWARQTRQNGGIRKKYTKKQYK